MVPSYPTNYNLYGSTTLASGSINNLQVNDGAYMSFHSLRLFLFSSNSTLWIIQDIGANALSIEGTIAGSLSSLFQIPVKLKASPPI